MGEEWKVEKKGKKKSSPPLPWTTKLFLSIGSFISDSARRPDITLNRRMLSLVDRPVAAASTRSLSISDVTVDPARRLWFRLYLPVQTPQTPLPVLVFFHGGGFAFLSADNRQYDAACRLFARNLPAAVVSVNYRLSPEHRWPAQYEDGVDVLRFLADGCGSDPRLEGLVRVGDLGRCFLAGDSAGANIAHNVAKRWTEKGENGRLRLNGVIAIQPFFGGEGRVESEIRLEGVPLVNVERTDWMWKAFLPEGEDRNHEAANVFGPRATELPEGFPTVMVVIGGFDPLQDWQKSYVEGLRARGKEVKMVYYPTAIHAFYLFPQLPESSLLTVEIKSFIESNCSGGKVASN